MTTDYFLSVNNGKISVNSLTALSRDGSVSSRDAPVALPVAVSKPLVRQRSFWFLLLSSLASTLFDVLTYFGVF